MFHGFQQSHGIPGERERWIECQKHGRKRFILAYSVAFGSLLFLLLRGLIYAFAQYGHTLGHGGKFVVATVGMLLSYAAGYRLSLLSWRRGVRLTSGAQR
jgi:hypothetical protein